MAPGRLRVDGFDGSAPVAIPGVPPPLRGRGRANDLASALEIAFAHTGLRLGYDLLMGLSGLAFSRPPGPFDAAVGAEVARAALTRLGVALEPAPELHDVQALDEGAVLELVAPAVDDGLPCAALGWGSVKDRWSLICGYDRVRKRLLGHCLLDEPREQYESWPPNPHLLITMRAAPRPRGAEAISQIIRTAAATWVTEVAPSWAAWQRALADLDGPPPAGHMAAVELLADARAAAAGFLEALAERVEAIPAAWMRRAAERYRTLVETLEAGGLPRSIEALALLEDPDVRRAWVNSVARAATIDEAAAADLRLSQEATWMPDDAE